MYVPVSRVSLTRTSTTPPPQPRNSLEHVSVELFLPVAQELADHLPAEAFALQQEVCHPHWRVRHKAAFDEVLDALLRFPGVGDERQAQPRLPQPLRACAPPWVLRVPCPVPLEELRTAQTLHQARPGTGPSAAVWPRVPEQGATPPP